MARTTVAVAVVTDSASNLPEPLARELGIEVVPLYLRIGEVEYRDGVDMTPVDLYERLVAGAGIARTASPSPTDFRAAYERTGASEIVCVTVAASMSAVHHAAMLGAEDLDGVRVEVIDSANASMAEGFVASEAARVAGAGAPLAAVVARAREVAERAVLFATVDTFEFLRRSGRVTKLQAYAATVLDLKPVFSMRRGEPTPVARPRTRRRALDRIALESLREIAGRPVHLAAFHAAEPEDAEELVVRIASEADVIERFVVPVTPVIGAHTGPGLVGTALFCD